MKQKDSPKKQKMDRKTGRMIQILVVMLVLVAAAVAFQLFTSDNNGSAKVIELDAGNGGDQTGDTGIINESDFAQGVTDELQKLLKKDSRFTVKLTHEAGTASTANARAEKTNEDKADLLISIHADASIDPEVSGMKIYADIPTAKTNADSVKIAEAVKNSFLDTELKPEAYYCYYKEIRPDVYQIHKVTLDDKTDYEEETLDILTKTEVPAVFVEQIYVTNQTDVDAWTDEAGYKDAAQRYYKAILEYFGETE